MRKVLTITVVIATLGVAGCMIHPLIGGLYTDTSFHVGDHNQTIGSKSAEACVSNILGLIAMGDASVKTAAQEAGITNIKSVDYKMTNVLGLFGSFCVLVTGD